MNDSFTSKLGSFDDALVRLAGASIEQKLQVVVKTLSTGERLSDDHLPGEWMSFTNQMGSFDDALVRLVSASLK